MFTIAWLALLNALVWVLRPHRRVAWIMIAIGTGYIRDPVGGNAPYLNDVMARYQLGWVNLIDYGMVLLVFGTLLLAQRQASLPFQEIWYTVLIAPFFLHTFYTWAVVAAGQTTPIIGVVYILFLLGGYYDVYYDKIVSQGHLTKLPTGVEARIRAAMQEVEI